MIYVLWLVAYLVAGLLISRWIYRRERWVTSDAIPFLIILWPLALTGRASQRFFRWFYKRPEVKK